jgi:hypothetical protein
VNIWTPLSKTFPLLFSSFLSFKAHAYTNSILYTHTHPARMLYTCNTKCTYIALVFSVHRFYIGTNIYHAQLLGSTHHYLVHTLLCRAPIFHTITFFLYVTPTLTHTLSHPILNAHLQFCSTQYQHSTCMHYAPTLCTRQ